MEVRRLTAIVRSDLLEEVEKRLEEMQVKGLSVTHVKGYGEYKNSFSFHDWYVRHARIEIFTEECRAMEIARAIMEGAHTGEPGDGMEVTPPVEKIFRIRSQAEAKSDEV